MTYEVRKIYTNKLVWVVVEIDTYGQARIPAHSRYFSDEAGAIRSLTARIKKAKA